MPKRSARVGKPCLGATLALIMACCDAAPAPEAASTPLTPTTASSAPLSLAGELALATEGVACVIDTYEERVHCVRRDGGPTHVFGRRGGGPGEFRYAMEHITRGPNGTVGVIGTAKMVLFQPTGTLVSEVRLPGRVRPAAPVDSVLAGEYWEMNVATANLDIRHLVIDIATGGILWERVFPTSLAAAADCPTVFPSGQAHPAGLFGARKFPSGGMVFHSLCRGQMLFFAHPDADDGTLARSPLYAPQYPTPADMARYLEGCRSPAAVALALPCEPDEYRARPKTYGAGYVADDQDRFWVLTNRDREAYSHFDVFEGSEYAGSVRVRHRGVGFDVLGSTLAVLVNRPVGPEDADGIPDRGIDWYDIGELAFGEWPTSEP